MTSKEFIESQGFTTEEPYSYYNQKWLDWMKEYAEYKCKQAIRNTKHAAHDIVDSHKTEWTFTMIVCGEVMNIQDKEVMPKF